MKLERVLAVSVRCSLFEVAREIDDGDGLKRTFLTDRTSKYYS